jgi:hypothetical protein
VVVALGVDTPKATESIGFIERPTAVDTIIDPEHTETKDARASTIIIGLCTRGPLGQILLNKTIKEQWETLKTLYAPLGAQQLSIKV